MLQPVQTKSKSKCPYVQMSNMYALYTEREISGKVTSKFQYVMLKNFS